ncbi:MAG: SDR family oxidoreductase [Gammaproteobacteria bacterium]|nr:SDR family oxidoreductase [Gammaproteobacteria bacterium]
MSLQGRVALVTGGGRGVGRAIAVALAEDGADVAVNYRRDDAAAAEAVELVERAGGTARAYCASIDDFEQDREMVEAVTADLGPISILVNNAGIASRGNSVADTDIAEMQRVVATHAFGAHYLSKLVIPRMRGAKRGDIVMISSAATRSFGANGAPYNMGKAALEALAMTLSKEEKRHDIRVNVVAPGLVETEMGRRLVRATAGVQDIRTLDADSPFGHVCQPEDVANVVRFLVSDSNSYVTGERLYVDGSGPYGA